MKRATLALLVVVLAITGGAVDVAVSFLPPLLKATRRRS